MNCIALDAKWTSYPKKVASNEDQCIAVSDYNAFIKDIAKNKDLIQNLKKIRPFITSGAGCRIYARMDKRTKNGSCTTFRPQLKSLKLSAKAQPI